MTSVLQALLHAPPLRNYFLGDRHNRFLCPRRTLVRNRAVEADAAKVACDLDEIFSAAFSGERTPYSPAKFLYRSGLWILHTSHRLMSLWVYHTTLSFLLLDPSKRLRCLFICVFEKVC
jgi:ubiquitin carboxyl-terminal hydrolase 22/27/51